MSANDYISGWEALNIPTSNGYIADWHPQFYFNEKKELKKYPYNEILKDSGISKRYIPFLNKDEYVKVSSSFWSYAVIDNNKMWFDMENVDEFDWIINFYDKFIKDLEFPVSVINQTKRCNKKKVDAWMAQFEV